MTKSAAVQPAGPPPAQPAASLWQLPRNIWAVSVTSFLTDVSSEMVLNLVPLFLLNVLGVSTVVIGIIEGVAESIASILKLFSGWLSDRLGGRKWVAVAGYGLSAISKPFFLIASTWLGVAAVRWADRAGKGIRTAPRDALVADSVDERTRGLAFGFHRAADTAGAMFGLIIAFAVVWAIQATADLLSSSTFHTIVLISLVPAFLAVLTLAAGARDVPRGAAQQAPRITLRGLGPNFLIFLVIVGAFTLGNSSDAFLILRAQNLGLSVLGVLGLLIVFNAVYALLATPIGSLSDRVGRRALVAGGWLLYALIYLGFAVAGTTWHIWALYAMYGVYYALTEGTAKALVADLAPAELRGTAYGSYAAIVGIMALPASLIAGLLWQGLGGWTGFGPAAPFYFGALMAVIAAVALWFWLPLALAKQ